MERSRSLTGTMTTSRVQSMKLPFAEEVRANRWSELRDDLVQAFVTFGDAELHIALDHSVSRFEARIYGMAGEAGASVAQILERDRFDADDVGKSFVFEGLDGKVVLANNVKYTVEPVLFALGVAMDVLVSTAAHELVFVDLQLVSVGAEPLLDQIGVRMSCEDGTDGCVEFAGDVDVRHALRSRDGDGIGGSHG